jgi:hypothetical protein
MIGPASVLRRRSDVRYRIVTPEAVVIRQSVPEVMVLNGVAAELLERLDAQTTVARLVEALLPLYEVDPAVLERDVLQFLGELLDSGVVEEVA